MNTDPSSSSFTKQTYYFTFGCGHLLAGHFIKLTGTAGSTRNEIVKQFGTRWSFQYDDDSWNTPVNQQEKWGYREIVVTEPECPAEFD